MTNTSSAFDPHALLAEARIGVLATIKANGMPQLSPVSPFYDPETKTILISVSNKRAKTANLRRDPRAALQVTRDDGWAWATAEGPVTLTDPTTDPHGPEAETLLDFYRRTARQAPDWDDIRATIVSDQLVLVTLKVEKVYGAELPQRLKEYGEKFK
ncbi:PPOX class F420-dependent oxidoreductase [Mycobacterium sp. pUA109]|uniref:PPOX class F420-dependent oxidoreductase n=1 Tax=Mycobacterium sp. pUA109 TaxID=3238982 RepID=UPI00351B131C